MTNVVKFPEKKGTPFCRTGLGQAFIYDGNLYIGAEASDHFNAVSVVTGAGCWFSSNDYVERVDLEIIVK